MTNNGILQGNNPKKERENEFFFSFGSFFCQIHMVSNIIIPDRTEYKDE